MGARYYDPSLGRFTQQDPVFNPLDPKQWNRYVYTGDDPVNFDDPTGLCSDWWNPLCWDWGGAVSAVWNFGTCVGKRMLPVNPDDIVALFGDKFSFGPGVNNDPAFDRARRDLIKSGVEKLAGDGGKVLLHGLPVVGWTITAVEEGFAIKACV